MRASLSLRHRREGRKRVTQEEHTSAPEPLRATLGEKGEDGEKHTHASVYKLHI